MIICLYGCFDSMEERDERMIGELTSNVVQ